MWFRGDEVPIVIQVTDRDEAMLAWLNVVRMADLEAVKFALAGLAGAGEPVGKRRANQWVARMEKVATELILRQIDQDSEFRFGLDVLLFALRTRRAGGVTTDES